MNRRHFFSALLGLAAAPIAAKVAAALPEETAVVYPPASAEPTHHVWFVDGAPNPLFSGEIGRYESVRFYESDWGFRRLSEHDQRAMG